MAVLWGVKNNKKAVLLAVLLSSDHQYKLFYDFL